MSRLIGRKWLMSRGSGDRAIDRAGGTWECPAILRDVGSVALRHRPGGGGIVDQRALSGDQRPVVGCIVIADRVGRQKFAATRRPASAPPRSAEVGVPAVLNAWQSVALPIPARIPPLPRAQRDGQWLPAGDGPGTRAGLGGVGDGGEQPAQLDRGRELAALLVDAADRGGLCLGDDEHAGRMGVRIEDGKLTKRSSARRWRTRSVGRRGRAPDLRWCSRGARHDRRRGTAMRGTGHQRWVSSMRTNCSRSASMPSPVGLAVSGALLAVIATNIGKRYTVRANF
jgi:hypothetical protein